jgi:TctA family transporter
MMEKLLKILSYRNMSFFMMVVIVWLTFKDVSATIKLWAFVLFAFCAIMGKLEKIENKKDGK